MLIVLAFLLIGVGSAAYEDAQHCLDYENTRWNLECQWYKHGEWI